MIEDTPKDSSEAVTQPGDVTELPSTEPELTIDRALGHRAKEAIVSAFIHEERLRGQTRKLTAAAWKNELAEFIAKPR